MSVSITLSANDTTKNVVHSIPTFTLSVGDATDKRTLDVTTSEYTMTLSTDVQSAGTGNGPAFALVRNFDSTNYVEIGIASATYFGKIPAGKAFLIPLVSTVSALYLKANTATCVVDVQVFEAAA